MCEQVNKIEVGKCYKLTDSTEVKIVFGPTDTRRYLAVRCSADAALWFTENGSGFYISSSKNVNVDWPKPKPAFAVGQVWKTRGGRACKIATIGVNNTQLNKVNAIFVIDCINRTTWFLDSSGDYSPNPAYSLVEYLRTEPVT